VYVCVAEKVKTEGLTVKCVPTSFQVCNYPIFSLVLTTMCDLKARQLIINNGLILSDLEQTPQVYTVM